LSHGALHVPNLALGWSGGLDPLRWFATNTTYHICMCEGLWRPLLGLDIERGWNWLGDSGVQRRRSTRDDQVLIGLVARPGAAFAVTSPRANERRVVVEGWTHDYKLYGGV
jgi:hypothetical protein